MRKEYDFSKAVPFKNRHQLRRRQRPLDQEVDEDGAIAPLTAAQKRELQRRIKDSDDRTRYLIVSTLGTRFSLYYNVSENVYSMNDPHHATLFKRRAAARAIMEQLGSGVKIVRCRVSKGGRLVVSSLPKARSPRRRRR